VTLRYGIIGTGMMGREHIRNIAAIPGSTVTALCDPFPGSIASAQEHTPDARVFAVPRDLLESPEVDAVVIASPNNTHIDVLRDALRSDKHILCEKPLCTTMEDCREVAALARSHRGVAWVGMEYRYMAPIARLVDEVRAGTVGTLRMLAIREHRFPFLVKVGDWNRFNRNTGGTLVEKCCHFFDLMRLITGSEAVRVLASGAQDVNHLGERYAGETPDILDNAYVVVDFANGVRAMLDLCMFAEESKHQEEVAATGDAGKVECFLPSAAMTLARRDPRSLEEFTVPDDPRVREVGLHHGSSYIEHLQFQRAVRGEGPVDVTIEDGVRAVAIGIAAHRSIAERRVVSMDELAR
jgi:predicted dehydrogenase